MVRSLPNHRARGFLPLAIFATAISTTTLQAQDAQGPEAKPSTAESPTGGSATVSKTKEKSEKVTVTGSRLKRIDVENAIPTKILRQEDFQKAGVTSVSELLQNQSENTFGSFTGGGGFVSVGQTTLDLHGLGVGRTLVLVDGRRLPAEASLGGTNINNIPLAMVERVEILKMSASAVYGADAVAGVVNVILKKAVSGSEVSTQANISQDSGGNSVKASAVTGFNILDTDVTLAIGGGQSTRVLSRDRKQLWKESSPYDQSTAGAPGGTYSWGLLNPNRPTSNAGDYAYRPSANCPSENQVTLPNDPANTLCRGDARKASTIELMPEKSEKFVTVNLERSFGDLQSSTTLMATTVDTASYKVSRTPTANQRGGAYNLRFGDAPDDLKQQARDLGLNYTDDQMIKITGQNLFPKIKGNTETSDTSLGALTSLKGAINEDWEWTVEGSHFTTKRVRTYHKAPDNLAFIKNLFPVSTTEAPKINIFQDDLGSVAGFFADLRSEEANSITSGTVFVNGPLFDLEGGKASVAAGVSTAHEKYVLRADPKDASFLKDYPETPGIAKARYLGSFASDGQGDRDVNSAFAEFDFPFLKTVDLALTGRFDHYSDFGSTFNYGSSVVVAPIKGLKLRGNVGSGFKAPSLAEVHNRNNGGYTPVVDDRYCDNSVPAENPCGTNATSYSVFVNSPGNKDLQEETSLTYNLGFVAEPADFIDFSVDYWSAKIKDVIGQEELDRLVEKELKGESLGSSVVNRSSAGRIESIDNSYANLGRLRSQGIDVASNLHFRAGELKYGLASTYSRVLSRKTRATQTDPEREEVGSYRFPLYRLGNSLFLEGKVHSVSLDTTTVGRQESSKFEVDPTFGYISPTTRYDVSYGWKYSQSGSLNLGVYNIENRIATVHSVDHTTGAVAIDRERADARGRQFQIGVRQAF
ncbi:MAG TPA: TonB-dependent receptor [Oligoflexus sp.]|uniref:TonB-dependent receptor plug domain-containing protein n=1 Tax=Oligoflexus sp. TaxID=1971216 RepID=UPI002D2801A6|nr:TonB-dependent receptor [Oligoflexus sp.]HYX34274.1 TonB-dependent receptor [Oligoflexus sp.]